MAMTSFTGITKTGDASCGDQTNTEKSSKHHFPLQGTLLSTRATTPGIVVVETSDVIEHVAAYSIEGLSSNQICQEGKRCAMLRIAAENPSDVTTRGFRPTNLLSVSTNWLIVRQARWRCSSFLYFLRGNLHVRRSVCFASNPVGIPVVGTPSIWYLFHYLGAYDATQRLSRPFSRRTKRHFQR